MQMSVSEIRSLIHEECIDSFAASYPCNGINLEAFFGSENFEQSNQNRLNE